MTFNSSAGTTFKGMRALLARNQTQQDVFNWIKLGGIDEWIGASVDICNAQYDVADDLIDCEYIKSVEKNNVEIKRCCGDGIQYTDRDHGLDDAGFNLV